MLQWLKRHPLMNTLFSLRGNARACVYTEPLWGVPYNLYAPFVTVYMYALGVKDAQIGLLVSVTTLTQAITSLLGGVITDKVGRRRTTLIFDLISWSVPCLLWAFSQNFWWFFVAAIVNGLLMIPSNSWTCLLVEGTDPKRIVDIYTWITVAGLLVVFFSPVSSVLVGYFSLIPMMRGLYLFSFVLMTTKFVTMYLTTRETEHGLERIRQTKGASVWKLLGEYGKVTLRILKNPPLLTVMVIFVLANVGNMITTNFFGLYVVNNLGLSEGLLPYFPMVRSGIMLLFILLFQAGINRLPFRPVMSCGILLYMASQMILLLTPKGNYWMLFVNVLAEAFAYALFLPRKDSILALFIEPQERARMMSVVYVIMLCVTSPFGALVGYVSNLNRRIPFYFNLILYGVIFLLLLLSKSIRSYDRSHDRRETA